MTRLLREPLFLRVSTIAIAAVLASAPVTMGSDLAGPVWKVALAEKGGKGGGGGNQGGGNHGGGNQGHGHAYGHDKNGGEHGRKGEAEYDSFGAWVDDVRAGKAFGHDRRDEHVEKAKERYQEAISKSRGQEKANIDKNHDVAHRFSPKDTKELIARGWRARTIAAGYRNHGQRVRTMVELAKRLGYDPRVGAMQANFGTPFENGIADLQAELAEAREEAAANPDDAAAQQRVEQLNAELAAAIAAAKPGRGPDDSWTTADLDVNDDGVVDPHDLAALDETPEPEDAAEASSS
ncbi:MAG TPA: hypothetical protein VE592_05565 [Geminicoccaceae bacterium]|jgi:hypothetical protein|nr:hypothetical protein [Geminicoccaceae bacterium]